MTRAAKWLVALYLVAEVLLIAANWDQSKTVYVAVYKQLWALMPPMDDPEAFAAGRSR